jgi:hypothetical protein
MARWENTANQDMIEVKQLTGASNGDMSQLKRSIDTWADNTPSGRQFFPFGRLREHGVSAQTSGGWVVKVEYGDRA